MKLPETNFELTQGDLHRYSRQVNLQEIGIDGQAKIKSAAVLCIGIGGLGSPLLIYLAASGIGTLGIVDNDSVEESNLHRQIIHSSDSLGKRKTESAYARIMDINPECNVKIFNKKLNEDNALEIISEFDIICDCTDNFPSRYLINDACLILMKPIVYGSILRFEGQASVFNLKENSPNYRDLVPTPPPLNLTPSCSEAGVIGVLPGVIGLIQATEVIKIITGIGEILDGRVLIYDALKMSFKELNLKRTKGKKKINRLIDYQKFCNSIKDNIEGKRSAKINQINAKGLKKLLERNNDDLIVIDVRNEFEFKDRAIEGAISIPLSDIQDKEEITRIREIGMNKKIIIYCTSGYSSLKAAQILYDHGINAISLSGGIKTWTE